MQAPFGNKIYHFGSVPIARQDLGHDRHHARLRVGALGVLPLHEARPRHARGSAAAGRGAPRRRAHERTARGRLGPRGGPRRGRRPDDGAGRVRPPADADAAGAAVCVRSRRARRSREPRRRTSSAASRSASSSTSSGQYVHFVGSVLQLPVAFAALLLVLLVKPTGLFGHRDGAEGMRRNAPALVAVAIARPFFALLPFGLSDYHRGLAAQRRGLLHRHSRPERPHGVHRARSRSATARSWRSAATRPRSCRTTTTRTSILTLAARVRDLVRVRRARRPAGAAPLRRLPRARDVRARGVGPAAAAEVLDVHGRQRRHLQRARACPTPGCTASRWSTAAIAFLFTWLVLRGRTGRAFRADPRQRGGRDVVGRHARRSTRRSPSASRRRSRASPARSSSSATNGFAQPNEFSRHAVAQDPRRRRSRRPRVALGRPPRRRLHRTPARRFRPRRPLIGSAHGQDVVFGLFVIVVMILLPTGVAGLVPRLRRLRVKA